MATHRETSIRQINAARPFNYLYEQLTNSLKSSKMCHILFSKQNTPLCISTPCRLASYRTYTLELYSQVLSYLKEQFSAIKNLYLSIPLPSQWLLGGVVHAFIRNDFWDYQEYRAVRKEPLKTLSTQLHCFVLLVALNLTLEPSLFGMALSSPFICRKSK